MLCGYEPTSSIMSKDQITSASCGPVSFSSVTGPSFLPSRKPVDVQAPQHAAVADVVDPAVLDERRRGDALIRPVVRAARRQLLVRLLPQELAGRLAERHQHAAIARLFRIPRRFVVGADEHHAARHDRVAVALRAELGHPLHVLLRLDVPLDRQALHVRDHVAVGRAAPHGPVAAAGVGRRPGAPLMPRRPGRATARAEHFSWLVGRQLEVVVIGAELRVGDEPGRPGGCRSDRPCRWPTAPAPASPVAHTLPRARVAPLGWLSTRSFR